MSTFDFNLVRYTADGLVWAIAPRRGVSVGRLIGNATSNGYVRVNVGGISYGVHRLVWELHNGEVPVGYEVDHINGDRADNRIENLRLATRSQNGMNHKVHKHNKLGIQGVSTRVRGNCTEFVGRITVNGKTHMKSSTCLSTVTDWLARMRPELHGKFANGGCH